jgi:protein CpxP
MKKFIISALAIVLSVASAMAQDIQKSKPQKSPDEKSGRFTQRMTRELSLDAAQQERVKAINLDRFKQIEETKAQAGLDAPARRQKLKEIEDNYFSTLKGVLTADQFTKFQALKAEMKEKAFERRNKN